MQERKSKMNAAIMESGSSTGGTSASSSYNDEKWNSAVEKSTVLNSAVARFLGSPSATNGSKKEAPSAAAAATSEPSSSSSMKQAAVDGTDEAATSGSEKENRKAATAATSLEMISTEEL